MYLLYPDIPNTELAAIHHYTRNGGNYRQLNKQMEKGTITDFNRAAQILIEQGLEKLPTYQGAVYRGMIIKRKEFDRVFGDGEGATVKQNRFVSSSKDMNVAFDFATKYQEKMRRNEVQVFIKIDGKNGRDISRISEFNGNFVLENQQEVLFTRNTMFRIDNVIDKAGVIRIHMTEL